MKHPTHVTHDRLTYNPAINARGESEERNPMLKATLREKGFGGPLLVRPAKRGSKYEIVNGRGRWLDAGDLIAEKHWPKDYPIPIFVRELSDAEALSLSIATAITPLPLNAADEALAFAHLIAAGETRETVAATYGVPVRRVDQRVAIGALPEPIVNSLRAGLISLDVAQAFTLTQDRKRQVKLWKEYQKQGNQTADWVRRMLTDKAIDAESREARLVGEEAYLAAGGTIRRDLFGEDIWFEDGALLNRLFDEKLASIKSDLEAEGWSFVKLVEPIDQQTHWQRLTPKDAPSPEDGKRLKAIDREIKALAKRGLEEEINDESTKDFAKLLALSAESDAIQARGFTDKQRKASGVVLFVHERNGLQILRGCVAPQKEKRGSASSPLPPAGEGGTRAPAREGEGNEEPDFTGQVLAGLAGVMGGALQMTLVEKPGQALRLLLATLIMQAKSFSTPLFRLNPQSYAGPSPAHEEYRAIIDELLRDAIDKDFFATLDHLDQLDEDAHHKLLAILLANSLNWSMHPGADGKALIRRLDPDCARWFKADEAFFNSLKKPQLVDALVASHRVAARS